MTWAPAYLTATQLKSYLRISDTTDDTELNFAIEAASRAVDHHTNRQFGLVASAEAREYTAEWNKTLARYVVEIDDLMTTTGLLVAADDADDGVYTDDTWTIAAGDFYMDPVNAPDKGRPWTRIVFRTDADTPTTASDGIRVTASYGWTTVPDAVEQATLLQASRFFARRNAPFGVAGSPEMGSELRLLQRVDVDVAVVLRSYIRWWGAT